MWWLCHKKLMLMEELRQHHCRHVVGHKSKSVSGPVIKPIDRRIEEGGFHRPIAIVAAILTTLLTRLSMLETLTPTGAVGAGCRVTALHDGGSAN